MENLNTASFGGLTDYRGDKSITGGICGPAMPHLSEDCERFLKSPWYRKMCVFLFQYQAYRKYTKEYKDYVNDSLLVLSETVNRD